MKTAVCLVVRDEERAVAEWIAYYKIMGFDAMIVADHGSADATVARVRDMAGVADVRVTRLDRAATGFQAGLYLGICRQFAAEFDWIAFFDVDEYLVGPDGLGCRDLLADKGGASAVVVPWLMFGSSGHVEKPGGLIIEDYCRRAGFDFPANLHVKSLVRPARAVACLNPHCFAVDGASVLPSGRPVVWGSPGRLLRYPEDERWRLHHYFTRSKSHWTDRLARGQIQVTRTMADFALYDRNEAFDDSARRHAAAVRRQLQRAAALRPA